MGRRRFLSALAGLGVSASALSAFSQNAVAELLDDPKREVPRVLGYIHTNHQEVTRGASPERTALLYKIPRDRWERIESAHDARRQLERQFGDRARISVTTNGNDEKQIDIELPESRNSGNALTSDTAPLEQRIPYSVDGVAGRNTDFESVVQDIPVNIELVETDREPETVSIQEVGQSNIGDIDMKYYHRWNQMPAGAACFFEGDEGFAPGTTTVPADTGGKKVMLTAGHNFKLSSGDLAVVHADNEGFDFTERDSTYTSPPDPLDTASMEVAGLGSVTDVQYRFAKSAGKTRSVPITGGIGRDHLEDLEDAGSGAGLTKQGAKTGRDTCSIQKVSSNAFQTNLDGGSDIQGGDSGGPVALEIPELLQSTGYSTASASVLREFDSSRVVAADPEAMNEAITTESASGFSCCHRIVALAAGIISSSKNNRGVWATGIPSAEDELGVTV